MSASTVIVALNAQLLRRVDLRPESQTLGTASPGSPRQASKEPASNPAGPRPSEQHL
jgi:hypothetical protein